MKNFRFLIILLFGFLLMPSAIFACENKSDKHSSTKETSSKMDSDDCCKNDNQSKTNNHDGCAGNCKHSKCSCISSCNSFTSTDEVKLYDTFFNFSLEKQKFCNYDTFLSSGFDSLWLIPKIG